MNRFALPARIAATLVLAAVAGCNYQGRIQPYADQVASRYVGEPAALALKNLGPPLHEHPYADMRAYIWQTGEDGTPGGNCRLKLVADRAGTIVDYTIAGTPLGCGRLLGTT